MECWWCFEPIDDEPSTEQQERRLRHFHPGCLAEKDGWLATVDASR